MMILLILWLILSLSAAAPLNSNVDKEALEEDLVTDDIARVGMDMDGLHNHTSKNTNRDKRHVFYGGNIDYSGTIHSTGAQARLNIGSISTIDLPQPDPQGSVAANIPQKPRDEPEPQGKVTIPCRFEDKELEPSSDRTYNPAYDWNSHKIPYIFTSTSDSDKQLFRNIMDIIEEKTCFTFLEKTEADDINQKFLEIETESESCETSCRGYVKYHNETNHIKLTSSTQVSDKENCKKQCQGFILHELMHALGVAHTFTRSDRDKFITVNEANLENVQAEFLFKKCENCVLFPEIPYDCNSIMHYGTHISGIEVMTPKDANACSLKREAKLVHGPTGSDLDWKLLNIIGKCSGVFIKELRSAIHIMEDELRKLDDTKISSDKEELHLEAKMTEITAYLTDECSRVDGHCQSEAKQIKNKIKKILSTFQEIKKTGKVSSEFLETFEEKKKNLDATAEEILKTWTEAVCDADQVTKYTCHCKDRSGETKTICNVGEICNNIGTCQPVCISGKINSADCGCSKTGEECPVNKGCNEEGDCLNVCPLLSEPLLSDCLCENPWKEAVPCAPGQVCKHGICSNVSTWEQTKSGDCWSECGKKGGPCPGFCGSIGYCCREGYDGCPPGAGEASPNLHTCVAERGDPEYCRAVDCSLTDSHKFCPIKCEHDQPEFCKVVDCNLPDSQDFCPFKCAPVCAANSMVEADCICKSKNEPCRRGKVCAEEGCMEMDPFFFLLLG